MSSLAPVHVPVNAVSDAVTDLTPGIWIMLILGVKSVTTSDSRRCTKGKLGEPTAIFPPSSHALGFPTKCSLRPAHFRFSPGVAEREGKCYDRQTDVTLVAGRSWAK
ncbi:hypothetical protein J6590_063480 [Homalodisca vitripennis]|nr:hypothetical protein J6590_063480 [Homalodisca vitripennis]